MDDAEYYRIDRMKREEGAAVKKADEEAERLRQACERLSAIEAEETDREYIGPMFQCGVADTTALRDTFAAAALTGLLAGPHNWDEPAKAGNVEQSAAEWAYKLADAMLEERKNNHEGENK